MVIIVAILLFVVGAGAWWLYAKGDKVPAFRTEAVKRGDLEAAISATGTVEPEEVVDVGAQVSGIISAFGKDKYGNMIDYGSPVEVGTVLARIDDSLYSAASKAAEAQLQQAIANKLSAEANVLQMQAKLLQATQDWERAQKLGPSDALAKSAYDQYHANYEVAKANLAASKAAVEQTKAAVLQAKANLISAQVNLGYCTIKSPVKGVIIDRRVNIGQTVVSSMSATSLFLIATDLKRIQIWLSVNEADIGFISKDQPVIFTVDAFPNRKFHGRVGKIRLNATMTQNVVTYTVEVDTKNDDGKLLPYLTANAKFKIGRKTNVLIVPNAALRWSPASKQISTDTKRKSHDHSGQSAQDKDGARSDSSVAQMRGTIWVAQGKFVRPVHVNVGMTDGTVTEVEGRDLAEGLQAVVGEAVAESKAGASAERNPFAPQMSRGRH
ncbi:MAG: efflux RND transporter periplasmic adaptor subunit [Nitrospirae bacterium]|nr:efflux RND transporter periplasmic adaptor subunit [Nitrospirota bacterium]MBF0536148.1 efflux RND transporter periplasmic adaptor subunit [Nitrospirota bacterium]